MLRHWRPVLDARMPAFTDEVEGMFRDFFRGHGYPLSLETRWVPPVDVYEAGNEVIVTMDLPAVDPGRIDISITGDRLTVEGERLREEGLDEASCFHAERSYGLFQRLIDLPAEVVPDQAKAGYKNGVLRITIPKRAREAQEEIKIEVR